VHRGYYVNLGPIKVRQLTPPKEITPPPPVAKPTRKRQPNVAIQPNLATVPHQKTEHSSEMTTSEKVEPDKKKHNKKASAPAPATVQPSTSTMIADPAALSPLKKTPNPRMIGRAPTLKPSLSTMKNKK